MLVTSPSLGRTRRLRENSRRCPRAGRAPRYHRSRRLRPDPAGRSGPPPPPRPPRRASPGRTRNRTLGRFPVQRSEPQRVWRRGEGTLSECDRGEGHAHAGVRLTRDRAREVHVGGWRSEEARGPRAVVGCPACGEGGWGTGGGGVGVGGGRGEGARARR